MTSTPKSLKFLSSLFVAAWLAVPLAQGQTVAWGTSANFTPISFTSNGTVDNQVLNWDLGWFDDGFAPDQTNYLSWAENWNVVDSSTYQDFAGLWAVSVNTLNVGSAAAGRQMYVFAHNDLSNIGTPAGEALLYRQDGQLFPTVPNQETFDIADNPLDDGEAFNDDAFTVIWGQVDRRIYENGGVLVGGGISSDPQLDSNAQPANSGFATFEAQSFTWIPEPSVGLLAVFGACLLLRRRR